MSTQGLPRDLHVEKLCFTAPRFEYRQLRHTSDMRVLTAPGLALLFSASQDSIFETLGLLMAKMCRSKNKASASLFLAALLEVPPAAGDGDLSRLTAPGARPDFSRSWACACERPSACPEGPAPALPGEPVAALFATATDPRIRSTPKSRSNSSLSSATAADGLMHRR